MVTQKEDQKLVFNTEYWLMQVKSIAECSKRAFCNTFDLHKDTIFHPKEDQNWLFNPVVLNAGQKYCKMLQESILQYFRPSLSYNLPLRSLFCLFLIGRLRHVVLYFLIPLAATRGLWIPSSAKVGLFAQFNSLFFICSALVFVSTR